MCVCVILMFEVWQLGFLTFGAGIKVMHHYVWLVTQFQDLKLSEVTWVSVPTALFHPRRLSFHFAWLISGATKCRDRASRKEVKGEFWALLSLYFTFSVL